MYKGICIYYTMCVYTTYMCSGHLYIVENRSPFFGGGRIPGIVFMTLGNWSLKRVTIEYNLTKLGDNYMHNTVCIFNLGICCRFAVIKKITKVSV